MSEEGAWRGRTALVTGGTGFIGSAIAAQLSALGAQVIVPTRDRTRLRDGGARPAAGGSTEAGSIRHVRSPGADADAMARMLENVDVVFNLAHDFRQDNAANFALYTALADACATAQTPMLVQASSIAVYDGWPAEDIDETCPCDGPGHDYKRLKRAIERDIARRVEAGQFDAVILQPTIVYGPGSPQWADALVGRMAGGTLNLPEEGCGLANGVYIDDVAQAFIAAGALNHGGARRFIISGPEPFGWDQLFEAYAEACNADIRRAVITPPSAPPAKSASAPAGPTLVQTVKAQLATLARGLSARLAARIGSARIERLRARIVALRPGRRSYNPVADDPRLFLSQGTASIEAMRLRLHVPQVSAEEGLARTQAYIRAKYPPRR